MVNKENYEDMASQLSDELNGNVEFCYWGDRPVILFSQPAHQPNMHQRTRKNEVPVFIEEHPDKASIKSELLQYWFVEELLPLIGDGNDPELAFFDVKHEDTYTISPDLHLPSVWHLYKDGEG